MDQLERERDCLEGGSSSSKVEPAPSSTKCKLEKCSSGSESISVSESDSEIECGVDESEYTSDDSDCSSQVSVIMRAPKTAVLNWLKGIEVNEDNKVKGANEIGNHRQHSHDREGDVSAGDETPVLNWLRGIDGEKNATLNATSIVTSNATSNATSNVTSNVTFNVNSNATSNVTSNVTFNATFNGTSKTATSMANHQIRNLTQLASDGYTEHTDVRREKWTNPSDSDLATEIRNRKMENGFAISQKLKSPCNHQHSFDFVEEEMTFIINVMPEEPTFDPLYKEHSEELVPADHLRTSETPLTTFAPHPARPKPRTIQLDQSQEPSFAIESEKERWEVVYKKENKKPSSLVENRLSCINELEEDESEQRQHVENERFLLPKNTQKIHGGEKEVKKRYVEEGQEICHLPEIEEEIVREGKESKESKLCRESEEEGEYASDNNDPSHKNGKIEDKSQEAGTCPNEEADNRDQEPSLLLESLSLSCYELEDVEEDEFEYLEVENKIDSFQGSIGFAIFRRKN